MPSRCCTVYTEASIYHAVVIINKACCLVSAKVLRRLKLQKIRRSGKCQLSATMHADSLIVLSDVGRFIKHRKNA